MKSTQHLAHPKRSDYGGRMNSPKSEFVFSEIEKLWCGENLFQLVLTDGSLCVLLLMVKREYL